MSATTKEQHPGAEAAHNLPGCCREGLARAGEPAVTTGVLPAVTCLPGHQHLSLAETRKRTTKRNSSADVIISVALIDC